MMPIGLLTAGPIAAIIAGADVFGLSAKGWLVVAILTLLTGMLSHGCIVFAQQHIPVATIGIMQTAQPALAVFFAFLVLGEEVRPPQVLGMALVMAGLALFTLVEFPRLRSRRRRPGRRRLIANRQPSRSAANRRRHSTDSRSARTLTVAD